MNAEPIIVTHQNVPALGTDEFDDWLKQWHTEHNLPEAIEKRALAETTFKLTAAGERVLAEIQAEIA